MCMPAFVSLHMRLSMSLCVCVSECAYLRVRLSMSVCVSPGVCESECAYFYEFACVRICEVACEKVMLIEM